MFRFVARGRGRGVVPHSPRQAPSGRWLPCPRPWSGLPVRGRCGAALPLLERALAINEAKARQDENKLATSLNNLASLYEHLGRFDDAEGLYRRALTIEEALLGPDHPEVAKCLDDVAKLYDHQGRVEDTRFAVGPVTRRITEGLRALKKD